MEKNLKKPNASCGSAGCDVRCIIMYIAGEWKIIML